MYTPLQVAFPDIILKDQLHFYPEKAQIYLGQQRMVMLQTAAFNDLRNELISSLGSQTARTLITRIGFSSGTRDAELALQLQEPDEAAYDLCARGAQLHAMVGIALVSALNFDVEVAKGRCFIEFLWEHTFEDELHCASHGIGTTPACWLEIGYASGFLSACMGKLILAREVECHAMGDATCRVIAQPADEWPDPELDLQYLEMPIVSGMPAGQERVSINSRKVAAKSLSQSKSTSEVVGLSPAFQVVLGKIGRVAATNATVLLLGESGVGKSAFARLLHEQSQRAGKPFVAINCAAIPETLMEAELFGVERGAFTGADAARAGRFDLAEGGTLFLDEVATLPLIAQSKLLRVLETGQFERLGSGTLRQANVRIVAATNEDLWTAVRAGRFREDLFFRLNVFPIEIPPLRNRKEDIPVLIEHFMKRFATAYSRDIKGLTPAATAMLLSYAWPGNIRELSNVIERAIILCDDNRPLDLVHLLTLKDLSRTSAHVPPQAQQEMAVPGKLAAPAAPASHGGEADCAAVVRQLVRQHGVTLADMENMLVRTAIDQSAGNASRAAAMLGITRGQLAYRQKKLSTGELPGAAPTAP
ncbi:MAG: sigma 54-interacting transcriptional regulator [Pseudomonadota bacterium]